MASFNPLNYTHPKFWPTWLGLGCLRLTSLLPWKAQQSIGSGLGHLAYYLAKKRRHIAKTNIDLCFPNLSNEKRQRMLRDNFASLGKGLIELGLFWHMPRHEYMQLCECEGLENLEAADASSNVILLAVHFTCMEACIRYVNDSGYSVQAMYRPAKNDLFEAYMTHRRSLHYLSQNPNKHVGGMVPHTEFVSFAKRLAKGQMSWYSPDQSFNRNSIFAHFFGIETACLDTTQKLARLGKAKVIPILGFRNNKGYSIRILPALDNFPSGNNLADTITINKTMEAMIGHAPEQYLWAHQRFKHMPDGSNPYKN